MIRKDRTVYSPCSLFRQHILSHILLALYEYPQKNVKFSIGQNKPIIFATVKSLTLVLLCVLQVIKPQEKNNISMYLQVHPSFVQTAQYNNEPTNLCANQ